MRKESENNECFGNKFGNMFFSYCTEKRGSHLYYMRMRNEKDKEFSVRFLEVMNLPIVPKNERVIFTISD